MTTTLPPGKKLTVTFRVEPGCLGPQGDQHVSAFCQFAQTQMAAKDAAFINWDICPRHDKSLPEVDFQLAGKRLTRDQAARYLALFDRRCDDVVSDLEDAIATDIGAYMAKHS